MRRIVRHVLPSSDGEFLASFPEGLAADACGFGRFGIVLAGRDGSSCLEVCFLLSLELVLPQQSQFPVVECASMSASVSVSCFFGLRGDGVVAEAPVCVCQVIFDECEDVSMFSEACGLREFLRMSGFESEGVRPALDGGVESSGVIA